MKRFLWLLIVLNIFFVENAFSYTAIDDVLVSGVNNPNWVDSRKYTSPKLAIEALTGKYSNLRINKTCTLNSSLTAGAYSGINIIIAPNVTFTITQAATYTSNFVIENGGQLRIGANITISGNITAFGNSVTPVVAVGGTETLTFSGSLNGFNGQVFGSSLTVVGSDTGVHRTITTLAKLKLYQGKYDKESIYLKGGSSANDGVQGTFIWNSSSTTTANDAIIVQVTGVATGRWIRDYDGIIRTSYFGDHADGVTNDADHLTAALAYAEIVRGSTIQNPTVMLRNGGNYYISSGIVIPYGITLDANGSMITYEGSGAAVTAGDRSDSLNYFTNFLNFIVYVKSHTGTGLKTLAVTESRFKGQIEGYAQGITNTRTNIGVEINGGSVSSFNNKFEVSCNHIHIGFKITSNGAGGSQPTNQLFLNCSVNGDQFISGIEKDNLSIGWLWDDLNLVGMGSGTKYVDCNAENVNVGIDFGRGCRGIDANMRWELSTTATSRQVIFRSNTDTIRLRGDGLQIATMGAVAGGIEGFSNGNHFIEADQNGHARFCGNDTNITSGLPTMALGFSDILLKQNNYTRIFTRETDTGTGTIFLQPGASSSYGGYIELNAHDGAIKKGAVRLGWSPGATNNYFQVTNGYGGGVITETNTSGFVPGIDDTYYLGALGTRWKAVYATNGTIQTSDKRMKKEIRPIEDRILDAWSEVNFVQFRWKKDDNKKHFGVIAQHIIRAFKKHDLNAFDYGIIYKDKKGKCYSVNYAECMILEMSLNRKKH